MGLLLNLQSLAVQILVFENGWDHQIKFFAIKLKFELSEKNEKSTFGLTLKKFFQLKQKVFSLYAVPSGLILWSKIGVCPNFEAFTKSLASELSRDITFAALMPWFQIQTLILTQTLTFTNTPNHTITLPRFQTLTQPRNEAFCPV